MVYLVRVEFGKDRGQVTAQAVACHIERRGFGQEWIRAAGQPLVIVLHRQNLAEGKTLLYDIAVSTVHAVPEPIPSFVVIGVFGAAE